MNKEFLQKISRKGYDHVTFNSPIILFDIAAGEITFYMTLKF